MMYRFLLLFVLLLPAQFVAAHSDPPEPYTLELQVVRPYPESAYIAPGEAFGIWLQSPYDLWDIKAEGFTFIKTYTNHNEYGVIMHFAATATAPRLVFSFVGFEGPRSYTLQEQPHLLLPLIQQGVLNG